tara:strand:- start:358 stop:1581 length:1224 start_codon:yes stop_codon:yes gene_type:complete
MPKDNKLFAFRTAESERMGLEEDNDGEEEEEEEEDGDCVFTKFGPLASSASSSSFQRQSAPTPDQKTFQFNMTSFTEASVLASALRAAIYRQVGFECCAGIANSRLACKIAVNAHKPNSQTTLLPSAVLPCILHSKLRNLHGIGRSMMRKLQYHNLNTVKDVLPLSLSDLCSHVMHSEREGTLVYLACRNEDVLPIEDKGDAKSITVQDSMLRVSTYKDLENYFSALSADFLERLDNEREESGRVGTSVTLKLRPKRQHVVSKSVTLPVEVANGAGLKTDRVALLVSTLKTMFRYLLPQFSFPVDTSTNIGKRDGIAEGENSEAFWLTLIGLTCTSFKNAQIFDESTSIANYIRPQMPSLANEKISESSNEKKSGNSMVVSSHQGNRENSDGAASECKEGMRNDQYN